MRIVFAFCALALASPASPATDGPKEFNSPTEAAVFAFNYITKLSVYYEYGGQILQLPDGKYAVAVPTTQYGGDRVGFSADPIDYTGKIVASYHTHPCLPFSHVPGVFSPDDLQGSRMFDRPSYMLDLCTGEVHLWAPGDPVDLSMSGNDLANLTPSITAVGKIVAHLQVSGTPLEAKE